MVDQYTAKRIVSLQTHARNETKRLTSIIAYNRTIISIAHTLENRQKSLGGYKSDGTLIDTLINLNQDIERLEVPPLSQYSSIINIPKLVDNNAIRQLLGHVGTMNFLTIKQGLNDKNETFINLWRNIIPMQ